jgi:hypothetical protein
LAGRVAQKPEVVSHDVVANKVAISYSRVSTGRQSGDERSGEERQQRAIESWLSDHPEYTLDREIKAVVSGAKAGRFEWFITELEKGVLQRGTCLVVEKVSRFSREPIEEVLKTLIRLWDAGGAIAFCELGGKVLDGFDQQSGDHFVVMGAIQRARGEWLERQSRSSAAAQKKRDNHQQGTHNAKTRGISGQADYPFWIDFKNGEFILNDWATHVKTIFKLAPKMGCTRIANYLDSKGIKSVSDRRKRWNPTSVKWVIRNKAALGYKVFWVGDRISDEKAIAYPPVVTQEEWDAAQTAMDKRAQSLPSTNSPTQANLFAGSIYCRHCGSPMILKASGNSPYRYLRCRNDYSICTHRGHQYHESFLLQHLAQFHWKEFFNAGAKEAAITSARSSLLEAEKVLRSVKADIDQVNINVRNFSTSDDPSQLAVLPHLIKRLDELLADQNMAQVEIDRSKAEVSKLRNQQTGREAERALKRQIDGFLSGKDNGIEERVAFNNWLREQNLVLCIEDAHDLFSHFDESIPSNEMQATVFIGEPVFDQGRLVTVNCLLESMKTNSEFADVPEKQIKKLHDAYHFESNIADPDEFQKNWELTVDKGWPTVELIGFRSHQEYIFWQDFVAAGGDDPSATFDGGVGLIHHPLTYDTKVMGKWTSRETRKRGRPARRKRPDRRHGAEWSEQ